MDYLRYVDNMLFILNDPQRQEPLIDDLNCLLHLHYQVKREEGSSYRVEFLDVSIFKGHGFAASGLLDFAPLFRDKGVPLGHDSAHPTSVLESWPLAYLHRLPLALQLALRLPLPTLPLALLAAFWRYLLHCFRHCL